MSKWWALTMRELKSLWYSPIGPIVGGLFLFLQGFVFWLLILILNDPRIDPTWNMARLFFGGFFYWLSLFITVPTLTMRTFSEEKRTGSIELLLTAPVTETQVVLSKFFGAWIAYALLWLSTILYFFVLRAYISFDWGPVLTGYAGTILMGGMLISVGIFTSSLTRNQVISGLCAFVVLLLFFSIGLLSIFVRDPEGAEIIRYLSLPDHINDFSRGFLDTRPLVFYASITAISLLLTIRALANPRWRS